MMEGRGNKKRKVLIGSNGGLTGIYLAKNLKQLNDTVLYGADCSDITAGKFFVDKQVYLPDAQSPEFIDSLITLLNSEKIDIYLPTHSKETKVISCNENKIRKLTETRFAVSPSETFAALDNKISANLHLQQIGVPVPKLIKNMIAQYPIFMKHKLGSGSKGTAVVENAIIHKAYRDTYEDVVFFQLIQGKEYTVDCFFDEMGNLLGFNQRQRIKTNGGAVTISKTNHDMDIEPWIKKISETWIFRGCVNFQYIVQNGMPYFIDINLRYPSGGLPLTVQSGLDRPKLMVKMLSGEKIALETENQKKVDKIMYRYYEEIFEECDSSI